MGNGHPQLQTINGMTFDLAETQTPFFYEVASKSELVDVYLIYSNPNKNNEKTSFSNFFTDSLLDLDCHLMGNPVFFNREQALQHAKFTSGACLILKASIQESAIVGKDDILFIKPGTVRRQLIRYALLPTDNSFKQIGNPAFSG